MFEVSDTQKIGVGLVGFGIAFLFLGVLLLFDNVLLAMGNMLFVTGVSLLIGLRHAVSFFFQPQKIKGSGCFFGGIIIVILGWSVTGMLIECVGLFYLFAGFIPKIIPFMRNLPVVSAIFYVPGVSQLADRLSASKLPV